MLSKDSKRKRTLGEVNENDVYEESDLPMANLNASDLETVNNKKRGRNKARKSSSGDVYSKDSSSDIDETGEEKVDEYGRLLGGREYKVPVFSLPTRGKTLFMFSKDPAVTLGYRDSFVFVKRNASLVKVQMDNAERGYLVDSNQLRPSFRTRELNAVTARSVYKQFGHRIVRNGLKGRDDYYFTEDQADAKRANQMMKTAPVVMTTTSIVSNPNTQPTPALMMGTNSLKCDPPPSGNALNWMHCAAVAARQFNSTLSSFRQSNSTHYDTLTNVYQIAKNKQFNPASRKN
ncbi:unnamed protein product [Rhizopus stolonifer]